jgi:hypothetical protein
MLDPDNRLLYTSALMPPAGMVFDEAIATAFSMDPKVLLEAPVYLAMLASDESEGEIDGLAVMESVRRYSDRIDVYVQKGRIIVPESGRASNPLYGFLERMIFEVDLTEKGGVFHPKIWLIRFKSAEKNGNEVGYRLLVTSRNLTGDNSWDLALSLDGRIGKKKNRENKPLRDFIAALPKKCQRQESSNQARAFRMAEELKKVVWELPEGFDEIEFYLPGHKKYGWKLPEQSKAMLVISPFCSDEALMRLRSSSQGTAYLVSREETLETLSDDTIEAFDSVYTLDPDVQPVLDDDDFSVTTGLHAKAYLFEEGWDTRIVLGSANATDAALVHGINHEILVSLRGKRSKVGSIEEILKSESKEKDGGVLGRYLIPFEKSGVEENEASQTCDEALNAARDQIVQMSQKSQMSLKLICSFSEKDGRWRLLLKGFDSGMLSSDIGVKLWPITVQEELAVSIKETISPLSLGVFDLESISGLIAFELQRKNEEVACRLRFVLNLPLEGAPFEQRQGAIMKRVIENWEKFRQYLILFLMDDESRSEEMEVLKKRFFKGTYTQLSEEPLLEELVKVFARHPEKLDRISEMIEELGEKGREIVDKDFLVLWETFEEARKR